jgi:hypothetical protein
LPRLLERFSSDEDFTAQWYYRAYKNPTNPFKDNLAQLKHVNLYISVGDKDMPKRIAMVRKTGMVIFTKPFKGMVPFCGVFICKNETGNKALREMEPPSRLLKNRAAPAICRLLFVIREFLRVCGVIFRATERRKVALLHAVETPRPALTAPER